jgi:hypothetical protein
MEQKVRIFKGKVKNVENEVNEFLTPKMIPDTSKEERIKVEQILQSSYVTLSGDNGVVMSIFYTTYVVHVIKQTS